MPGLVVLLSFCGQANKVGIDDPEFFKATCTVRTKFAMRLTFNPRRILSTFQNCSNNWMQQRVE
ncbi:MAG: hypothetical protein ACJ74Z_21575 [Bryobacteraceae bacterium]